ncbi:hypothetical protein [Streptomyces galbus]|uniref:Integral membrane protein n=1 Tax=Streptomyces galbus TaxID=33898 RepID=A0A4U5WYU8_STRGB|nr:hypothetical protein [Streptomyces galbus]TKT07794.1 hypothetical protein E4U92_20300 [Streptomyces galbus]GHD40551.1 hypothetical protein GCM10010335_41550 [Streptomyces galbus]
MASGANVTLGALLLTEYERLKDEQRSRIAFRDNLVYAMLASAAAVLGAALRSGFEAGFLLLLPPVAILLGWTYLINDQKISAMGQYIRGTLAPRLAAAAGAGDEVFGWETAHRGDARRVWRKRMQLAADLIAFVLTPSAAILTFLLSGHLNAMLVVVAVLEAAATAVLGVQIVLYADLAS